MSEEKVRFQMRISPDTDSQVKALMPKANCQSQNEFVEEALKFFCACLTTQDTTEFLPPIFVHAMRGTIQCSEDRIARLLFKLTVEISMMMNVLAAGLEIDSATMRRISSVPPVRFASHGGPVDKVIVCGKRNGSRQ